MNKQEIYELLKRRSIQCEIVEHPAVYNMEEVALLDLPHPEADAKNLFVRDNKKRQYYMITVKGEKRVDLKRFKEEQGTRPLGFASETDLSLILGLTPGSVTPLGLLNDAEQRTVLYIDRDLKAGLIGVHPNDNTATVYLKTEDLIELLESFGCEVRLADL